MLIIMLLKIIYISIFLIVYVYLWKFMRNIELKIIYNFFIIFFYIGGGISSLLIDYTDIVMPQSGIKAVELNIIGWNIYFIIIYVIPTLTLLLATKILTFREREIKKMNLLYVYMIVFIIFIYLYITDHFNLNNILLDYESLIKNRYDLAYSYVFTFLSKVLTFILLLTITLEYLVIINQKNTSLFMFVISVMLYALIDVVVFSSKLYIVGFIYVYLIAIFISYKMVFYKIFPIVLSIYIIFYTSHMGQYYEIDILNVILQGLTRFTLQTPFFIDYYMSHNFDWKFYFYSTITGNLVVSPNIKVFDLMFYNDTGLEGSLASNIFLFNYANYGIFSILVTLFEMYILFFLYKLTVNKYFTSLNLAVFLFLCFGILNYGFLDILLNPLNGYFLLLIMLLINNRRKEFQIKYLRGLDKCAE